MELKFKQALIPKGTKSPTKAEQKVQKAVSGSALAAQSKWKTRNPDSVIKKRWNSAEKHQLVKEQAEC